MARRGRCRICKRWFRPDPRAGSRQRVCSDPACQRERHRRSCASWHARNPHYDRHDRLVGRLIHGEHDHSFSMDPLRSIDWEAARDEIGLEAAVLIEESGKVLVQWARDEILPQVPGIKGSMAKVSSSPLRDDMVLGPGPP